MWTVHHSLQIVISSFLFYSVSQLFKFLLIVINKGNHVFSIRKWTQSSLSSEFDPRETNTQSSFTQTINPFYYVNHQMVKVVKFIGNDKLHVMLISVAKNRRYVCYRGNNENRSRARIKSNSKPLSSSLSSPLTLVTRIHILSSVRHCRNSWKKDS